MPRGQMFATSSSDATTPSQQIAMSMCEPVEIHSSVGANQKRAAPK